MPHLPLNLAISFFSSAKYLIGVYFARLEALTNIAGGSLKDRIPEH